MSTKNINRSSILVDIALTFIVPQTIYRRNQKVYDFIFSKYVGLQFRR